MSNRCPDCAKMVSLEFQDPEVDGDIEGEVTRGPLGWRLAGGVA